MIKPRRERTVRARVLWGFHPKDRLSAAPGIAFQYLHRTRSSKKIVKGVGNGKGMKNTTRERTAS